jgi:hypothetical protein
VVVDGRGFGSRDPLAAGDTALVTVVGGRTATAEPAVVVPSMSTGESVTRFRSAESRFSICCASRAWMRSA